MEVNSMEKLILSTVEACLSAQLNAVRKLMSDSEVKDKYANKSKSQPALAYNILAEAGTPLHITEIIRRIQDKFDVTVDCESLASALSKKVLEKIGSAERKKIPLLFSRINTVNDDLRIEFRVDSDTIEETPGNAALIIKKLIDSTGLTLIAHDLEMNKHHGVAIEDIMLIMLLYSSYGVTSIVQLESKARRDKSLAQVMDDVRKINTKM